MEHLTHAPTVVAKEHVGTLHFPTSDVLTDEAARRLLRVSLTRAQYLGNLQKRKVKIYYEDAEGAKMTETTIWAVTDKNVLLKQGVTIPIHRITEVSAY